MLWMSRGVDRMHCGWFQEGCNRAFGLLRAALPVVVPQLTPDIGEPDLVGVRILDNEPFQPLGMPIEDTETNRATIVLHVDTELPEIHVFQQSFDDIRGAVKWVTVIL